MGFVKSAFFQLFNLCYEAICLIYDIGNRKLISSLTTYIGLVNWALLWILKKNHVITNEKKHGHWWQIIPKFLKSLSDFNWKQLSEKKKVVFNALFVFIAGAIMISHFFQCFFIYLMLSSSIQTSECGQSILEKEVRNEPVLSF